MCKSVVVEANSRVLSVVLSVLYDSPNGELPPPPMKVSHQHCMALSKKSGQCSIPD